MSLELAPNIRQRVIKQRDAEKSMQKHGEHKWAYPLGNYTNDRLIEIDTQEQATIQGIQLQNYELFLYDQTKRLLDSKKQNQPIIIMDIGGGVGESWLQVASAYRKEIAGGEVAFVVSNLVFTPEQQLANYYQAYKINREDPHTNQQAHENNLVHFVTGNLNQLRKQTITLPNGHTLPLRGNVNLVHEKLSITAWSHTPDLDIPKIARLLSPESSIYMLHGYYTAPSDRSYAERDRVEGIRLAHKGLEKTYGLERITHTETGRHQDKPLTPYIIFRTPKAPQITVN